MNTPFRSWISFLALSFLMLTATVAPARPVALFSPESDLVERIAREIGTARRSVDLAIYTFSSPLVLKELEDARSRGVKVRLLVRKSIGSGQPGFLEDLAAKGAEIRWINKINHHKFAVIDGETLLSSSGNFSETALQKSYDENLVVCGDCRRAARAYAEEFEFLFASANPLDPGAGSEVAPAQSLAARPAEAKNPTAYFTSRNFRAVYDQRRGVNRLESIDEGEPGNVETRLIAAIEKARTRIQVATGHFRSWNLMKALTDAVRRGVNVELVLDSQEYVSTFKRDAERRDLDECIAAGKAASECRKRGFHYSRHAYEGGVDVRIKSYALRWDFMKAPQMHHKYMIIDGKTVYTGSYNWSFNAEFESTENVWVLKDARVVGQFIENFRQVRSYGEGDIPNVLRRFREATTELPFHYPAMSLSYPEMDELRAIACQKYPDVFCSSDIDEERLSPPKRGEERPHPADRCQVTGPRSPASR